MTDTVAQLVLKSELPAYVELFQIDCTSIPGIGITYYLTPGTANNTTIMFGLQAYTPFPIQISGLEHSSEGAPARPRIDIANVTKLFGSLAFLYQDLVGAKVVYIRTWEPYLNLPSSISAAPLKLYVSKKLNHEGAGLSFELRSVLDKERAFLPARQMLKNTDNPLNWFPGLSINKAIR